MTLETLKNEEKIQIEQLIEKFIRIYQTRTKLRQEDLKDFVLLFNLLKASNMYDSFLLEIDTESGPILLEAAEQGKKIPKEHQKYWLAEDLREYGENINRFMRRRQLKGGGGKRKSKKKKKYKKKKKSKRTKKKQKYKRTKKKQKSKKI